MTQLNLHRAELLFSRMAHVYYTHTGDNQRAEFWGKVAHAFSEIYVAALDLRGGK